MSLSSSSEFSSNSLYAFNKANILSLHPIQDVSINVNRLNIGSNTFLASPNGENSSVIVKFDVTKRFLCNNYTVDPLTSPEAG